MRCLVRRTRRSALQLVDQATGQPLFDSLIVRAAALREQTITFGSRSLSGSDRTDRVPISPRTRAGRAGLVLMIGVLSTSLLGALLMLSTGERQRFARLLTERTRERDRIWQVSEDLLGVGNFEGYFISVNPAWTRTLGWSEDEIKTLHVDRFAASRRCADRRTKAAGGSPRVSAPCAWRTGSATRMAPIAGSIGR